MTESLYLLQEQHEHAPAVQEHLKDIHPISKLLSVNEVLLLTRCRYTKHRHRPQQREFGWSVP